MQQRTRHASLDFPRSNRHYPTDDEWGEFLSLSTSMLALSEDNNGNNAEFHASMQQPPRSMGSVDLSSQTLGSIHHSAVQSAYRPESDLRKIGLGGGARNDTIAAPSSARSWRPLGRRASAHVLSTSNQFDASLFGSEHGRAPTLKHATSFGGMIKPQLSSPSSSSIIESSSSDEDQSDHERNGENSNQQTNGGGITGADSPYGPPRLPVLTSLPSSSNGVNAPPLVHAKSPVLSNRKDEQTWQLKEEELLASPRFSFRSSLDEDVTAIFDSGMSLLDNQTNGDEQHQSRGVKDTRASSADFTHSRAPELNPPLPPQDSLHKLRSRSLSYSASYGSGNFNPSYSSKQYMPPGTTIQQDFPTTMRQFHSGPPPPPQSVPHSQGHVRPPRVTIPVESPMHPSYHQQPIPPQPQSARRYSTDYAMPSYADGMPHEPEPPQHRPMSGRNMRSYSSEFMGFPSNARSRSQSMEGNQLFAPAASPIEYPMMTRHNSYEWPRSPVIPPAPPLPPDSHPSNGNGNIHYPTPPPEAYYEVMFKRGRMEVFAGDGGFNAGEYVKVEADRGEDIGKVVRQIGEPNKPMSSGNNEVSSPREDVVSRTKRHDGPVKKVIAVASPREFEMLQEQRKEEHEVFEVCKSKVRQRLLPMNVIDAEYQFDRHKLTFFFEADRRIDFRELVRDLFAIYKTRIWLQQVVPGSKKMTSECDTI